MGLSVTSKNTFLNNIVGRTTSISVNGGVAYMGLSATPLSSDGSGITEPSTTANYSRVLIGNYNTAATQIMSSAANGITYNTSDIVFPAVGNPQIPEAGDWGTLRYVFLSSSLTGNAFIFGQLAAPVTPESGSVVLFRANPSLATGDFSITFVDPV